MRLFVASNIDESGMCPTALPTISGKRHAECLLDVNPIEESWMSEIYGMTFTMPLGVGVSAGLEADGWTQLGDLMIGDPWQTREHPKGKCGDRCRGDGVLDDV
jgi:hypothetical protein